MLEQLVHVHISLHKKDGASAHSAQQHQTAENEEEEGLGLFTVRPINFSGH